MIDPKDLISGLDQFTGTEEYHRWSSVFPNFVLTDGAKFLAKEAECYWLMDMIASYRQIYADEGFASATLSWVEDGTWVFTLDDGNGNILVTQKFEFSDFPLPAIGLFVAPQGDLWVIMLRSEY